MPLTFPSDRKPDTVDKYGSTLRCVDPDRRRLVSLYVHTATLHRIGTSKGVAAKVIDEDLSNHLMHFLADILTETSKWYDAHPAPKPARLEIGRIGVFAAA
jgi:hypothetical protein